MKQKRLITFTLLVITLMCYTITAYADVLEKGKEVAAEGYDQICQNLKDTTDAKAWDNVKETATNLISIIPVCNVIKLGKECVETANDASKSASEKGWAYAKSCASAAFNCAPAISATYYTYKGVKAHEEIQNEYGGALATVDNAVNEYAEMGYGTVENVKNNMSWGMTLSATDKFTVTSEALGGTAVHSNAVQGLNDYAASCDLVAGYTDSVAIQQSSATAADGTGQTSSNDNYFIYIIIAIIALIVILLLIKLFNKPRQPIVIQDTMPPPAPAGRSLAARM